MKNKFRKLVSVKMLLSNYISDLQKESANFIFTNTLTERFNKFVLLTSQRSGQPGINAKEYGEYEFYCPNKDEQESIGRFFRYLDETLVLQQQQLQTLKNLKQAFLEKMFV